MIRNFSNQKIIATALKVCDIIQSRNSDQTTWCEAVEALRIGSGEDVDGKAPAQAAWVVLTLLSECSKPS